MNTSAINRFSPAALAARLAIAAAVILPAGAAGAQELVFQDTRPVRFFVGGGLTAGGDRLVTARYINGSDESLHGGGTIQVHAGLEFRVAPSLTMALSAGYHLDAIDTFWGSTWFGRVPIEALAHFQVDPRWRVGGGVRFAVDPTLSSDGFGADVDEHFRSSVGPVVEVEYLFNPRLGLKLRGVSERYKSKQGLPTVDGNHVGLLLNFYF
jgi:hypothetical protein